MADTKISNLPATTTPADADLAVLVQEGATKKVTWLNAWINYFKAKADALYQATGLAALKANNLSDLTDAATARTNLGLGTAAVEAATAFASASKFVAGAGALTGPASPLTIGTAAGAAIEDFAPAAGSSSIVTVGTISAGNVVGGIADHALAISKLANGTAGNLLTWGADTHPTTVATGDAGQVLTSNGAGAAPTFQSLSFTSNNTLFTQVRCATTANITVATALNSGDTIDGVTLANDDRVLVWCQTDSAQNGIYIVGDSPARASDYDSDAEIRSSVVLVQEGTSYAKKVFENSNASAIVVGTTGITYRLLGMQRISSESLAGTKQVTYGVDAEILKLNPNGSDRYVDLLKVPLPPTGAEVTIISTDTESRKLTVRNGASGGTIFIIGANAGCIFRFDGSDWIVRHTITNTNARYMVALGENAHAFTNADGATAIGRDCKASGSRSVAVGVYCTAGTAVRTTAVGSNVTASNSYATAVGATVTASGSYATAVGSEATASGSNATAVGYNATANATQSTAIGYYANTNSKDYSCVLGHYAQALRYGETAFSTETSGNFKFHDSLLQLCGSTTNATPTELFIKGTASNRVSVIADSAFSFTARVVAYSTADDLGKAWEFRGAIKRKTNATSLIGTVEKTVVATDGGDAADWDFDITADDTNEALAFTATGEVDTTIKWKVQLWINELLI